MQTLHSPTTIDHGHLEATSVGETAWRVSDATRPEADSRHVVAFVEGRAEGVEVVWLRGATSAPGRYRDLDSALDAIDELVSHGTT